MPKSPNARQNASTVPARIDRHASGTEIVQKMLQLRMAERLRGLFEPVVDRIRSPTWTVLISSAIEPTAAATTAARQVNASSMFHPSSMRPTTPRAPISINR